MSSKTVVLSTDEFMHKIDEAFDCGGVAAILSLAESITENIPEDSPPADRQQLLGILNLYVERMDPHGTTRAKLKSAS